MLFRSLSAVYLLWMVRRVFFGPCDNPENMGLLDLGLREKAMVVALLVPMYEIFQTFSLNYSELTNFFGLITMMSSLSPVSIKASVPRRIQSSATTSNRSPLRSIGARSSSPTR